MNSDFLKARNDAGEIVSGPGFLPVQIGFYRYTTRIVRFRSSHSVYQRISRIWIRFTFANTPKQNSDS
jgi:hypothetical protein